MHGRHGPDGPEPGARRIASSRPCAGDWRGERRPLMKYLVLSDIHSNHEALRRRPLLRPAQALGQGRGAGRPRGVRRQPQPGRGPLRGLRPLVAIRGNHDKVCSGIENGELFNRSPSRRRMWTRRKLTPANLRWLHSLPEGPAVVDGAFAISHGTPIDEDAYIFGEIEALNVFRHTDYPVCFFGHSHFPVIFGLSHRGHHDRPHRGPVLPLQAQAGRALPHQPGLGGPAPRRESPRLLRLLRHRHAGRDLPPHPLPRRGPRSRRSSTPGLPRPLADRLALGR